MNQGNKTTSSIGFLIGMSSWSLSFITLIWAYVVFRMRLGVWYVHVLTKQDMDLGAFNTVAIVASSFALRSWVASGYRHKERLWVGLGLGLLFMAGQWHLWQGLLGEGFTHRLSVAASFFYVLTGFHGLHIVAGLLIVGMLARPLLAGARGEVDCRRFNNALIFWDLLAVFWVVLFILIFAIK